MRRSLVGVSVMALAALSLGGTASAQAPQPGDAPKATPTQPGRTTSYDVQYFSQFGPRSALDIVQRIPGFTLDLGSNEAATGVDVRGFAGTAGNVVFNGARPSSKSETLETLLSRIPASRVKQVIVGPGDLYGADYSSKTQVANLILSADKGIAGTVNVSAVRHWFGKIEPNASGSILFSRGPSTFNLSADTGRADYYEEGFDRLNDAQTGELLEYRRKFNSIHPHDPYLTGGWSLENGDNNSIHVNGRIAPSRFYLLQTNHVIPTGGDERDDNLVEDYKARAYELGGDITRPLAGGAIKLLGLANRRHRTTLDRYLFRTLNATEILGGSEQRTTSQRNETIGRLTWAHPDILGFRTEVGGEASLNTLDYNLTFFDLGEGGVKIPSDFPPSNAKVKETRGEVWINAGRPLTKKLRMDAGLNFEFSHLTVSGDAEEDRRLKFLKPSVTLDWQAPGGWHAQLIARRTVAQLDFFDFVYSADLAAGRVNGGNSALQPQRSWEGRLLFEHSIFKEGKVRLELGYDRVSLLQDRILVFDDEGNAFDAPGNIGTGRRKYADLTIDTPLDKVWKGLRVRLHGQLQSTRVEDPIRHFQRDWSGFYPRWQWDVDIRRDVGNFAYGISSSDRRRTTFFRTDEFDTNFNDGLPYTTAFIEYRPSDKRTITLNFEDLSNTGGSRERILFRPNRTVPDPTYNEFRYRNSHVRVGVTFKQSFGGGGVAKAE